MRKHLYFAIAAAVAVVMPRLALARMAYAVPVNPPPKNVVEDNRKPLPFGDLTGIKFGVALGATYYPENNVISTVLPNNIIRLNEGGRGDLGFWVEVHSFSGFGDKDRPPKDRKFVDDAGNDIEVYRQGWGPFVAIKLGADSKVVQALGVGLMYGKRMMSDKDHSVNFGLGISANQISVLTAGQSLNQPLPTGITAATTRNKIVIAPMFITSFSF